MTLGYYADYPGNPSLVVNLTLPVTCTFHRLNFTRDNRNFRKNQNKNYESINISSSRRSNNQRNELLFFYYVNSISYKTEMNWKPVTSIVCSLQSIEFERINKVSSRLSIEHHKHLLSMIGKPIHIYRFVYGDGEVKQQVCSSGYYEYYWQTVNGTTRTSVGSLHCGGLGFRMVRLSLVHIYIHI